MLTNATRAGFDLPLSRFLIYGKDNNLSMFRGVITAGKQNARWRHK
jgi:hypothetical protein